jgi:predicted DNA-binding protein
MAREIKDVNLTIRIPAAMSTRLHALEATTKLSRAEVVRRTLDALLEYFEDDGTVEFPIQVISRKSGETMIARSISQRLGPDDRTAFLRMLSPEIRQLFQEELEDYMAFVARRRDLAAKVLEEIKNPPGESGKTEEGD